ncbi:MAG: M24 family metallopeptidase [Actinomycetales bacterium]
MTSETDAIRPTLVAPICSSEYLLRQGLLRELLQAEGFDGAIVWGRGSTNVDGSADLLYVTGHLSAVTHILDSPTHSARGHAGLVLPVEGPSILVTDSYDADFASIPVDDARMSIRVDVDTARAAVEAGLQGRRIALIGMSGLLFAHHARMVDVLGPNTTLVPADEILVAMRVLKSEAEIDLLREASRIGCDWVNRMIDVAVPGVTEGDVVGEGLQYLASAGGWPYDVAVGSGPHSHRYRSRQALPTWDASYVLKEGDLFHADVWGPTAHGYFCDLTRSTVVGAKPTASQARALNDSVDLVEHVTTFIEPGVRFGDLQERAGAWLAKRDGGGGSAFSAMIPFVGHSLGLECEAPFITSIEDTLVAPGMVLAIECFLGGDPGEGAGFEHVLVVREGALEILTLSAVSRPWASS